MDVQGKGELDINDMRYLCEQLGYGYSDEQLWDLIHSVGGYGAETISADRFNRFIEKKTKRKVI
jgi:Ca2+-binding EF-hand superfamily protein